MYIVLRITIKVNHEITIDSILELNNMTKGVQFVTKMFTLIYLISKLSSYIRMVHLR